MYQLILFLYKILWFFLLPIIFLYFIWRSRKDHRYSKFLSERFGTNFGIKTNMTKSPVWIHGVSLGETRSAFPLIEKLLLRDENVVTTHLTPVGREAMHKRFSTEIKGGRIISRYLPIKTNFALLVTAVLTGPYYSTRHVTMNV